jgi:hypothetical protein
MSILRAKLKKQGLRLAHGYELRLRRRKPKENGRRKSGKKRK